MASCEIPITLPRLDGQADDRPKPIDGADYGRELTPDDAEIDRAHPRHRARASAVATPTWPAEIDLVVQHLLPRVNTEFSEPARPILVQDDAVLRRVKTQQRGRPRQIDQMQIRASLSPG